MSTSTLQLNILETLSEQITAEEFKASLPIYQVRQGKPIYTWSLESYGTYVNLAYPHITVPLDQEWKGPRVKTLHVCERHGNYWAAPCVVTAKSKGCQCSGCKSDACASRNHASSFK